MTMLYIWSSALVLLWGVAVQWLDTYIYNVYMCTYSHSALCEIACELHRKHNFKPDSITACICGAILTIGMKYTHTYTHEQCIL